ncbi:MAG TPA: ABC transporter permease subunit [Candidatus Dormibacteraeota bacterium]|jgi:phosphate transport system permease protein|nr:ABC transporter permease subunit [Candidatus Dormibacteraeota bacterium]
MAMPALTARRSVARSVQNLAFWGLCALALAIIMVPSIWIIVGLIKSSLPLLNINLITQTTTNYGLQNAILGTLLLSFGVLVVAGPIGIGAGIFLAEFAPPRTSSIVRFFSEVLAGVPSIVIGYTGYVLLAVRLHWGFSLLSAILALTALVTPYIAKTTEVSLRQVPTALHEGAVALGLTMTTTLRKVLLPPALPGMVTGLVVAVAISTGETAPLLYTANFNTADPTLQLTNHPVGYLTYVIYEYIQLPGDKAHALANAAAAVTLIFLIILIAVGRFFAYQSAKRTNRMNI